MSWRFRKTFRVLPGVKLNLTARGLSATLGASPFSINVGPRGVYRNVSIPGTGIWDRQRIGGPSPEPSDIQGPLDPSPVPLAPSLPTSPVRAATEIRSASTESLGSESMAQLRRLLTDTYNERDTLTMEIAGATLESHSATSRYQSWDRGFLMKLIRKESFAARKEAADTAAAKLEELQEQLRLTALATEITLDKEQAEPYYRMRDDFAALSGCQKIWNVLADRAIDRVAERSTANTSISREPVSFSLDSCDLIKWEQKPHMRNLTGGDMYVYPGFILYRVAKQAFALIDSREVTLTYVSTQFTETETIPTDTQIVGKTWAKANKDGSPDRRFHGNHQIPLARYGTLFFTSPDGLDVRYMCSNAPAAEQFAKSWTAFRMSFSREVRPEGNAGSPARAGTPTEAWKQAFEAWKTAFETFKVAQETFLAPIRTGLQDPTRKGTMTEADVAAYITALRELIVVAKHLEEGAVFVAPSVRSEVRRVLASQHRGELHGL
jgi:hypothetical protein